MTLKQIGHWMQIAAVMFLSSMLTMCQTAGQKKEREYHDSQFNQFVYASTCQKLWPSVKGFLAKDKFRLPDPAPTDRSFVSESEWKDTSEKMLSEKTRERIVLQARDVEAKGCALEVNWTKEATGPNIHGTQRRNERDAWRERKLIETIEPARYQKIIEEGARIRTEADGAK